MNNLDPIGLLFGCMDKLGPGSDADTRAVLKLLPGDRFEVVVDAGCGTGRQTLVLAKELQTTIHAVDNHKPFLVRLQQRAVDAQVPHWVAVHCLDMVDIPKTFPVIDLLWSEAAAYSMGFENALCRWKAALSPRGFLVVSELCWSTGQPPDEARSFFSHEYPAMQSVEANVALIESLGYQILTTYTLLPETWTEGYYDVLKPRATELQGHPESAVRSLATEMLQEIEVFEKSAGSYAYVFFVLQPI